MRFSYNTRQAPVNRIGRRLAVKRLRTPFVALATIALSVSLPMPSWAGSGGASLPPTSYGSILLPTHRIVAYYGSPLTPFMGILGETPTATMLAQLDAQAAQYAAADPSHPVVEALEMVAVVASRSAQADHTYRLRMPYSLIQQELDLARSHHAILILDIQVGHSTIPSEIAYLAPFLKEPDVQLALDPEFDMPPGDVPGKQIGTMSTADINYALQYLNNLAIQYHLPQKLLIVHQFRQLMIPDWAQIQPVPNVAFVRDMDGFGGQPIKSAEYELFNHQEAVTCTLVPFPAELGASNPEWYRGAHLVYVESLFGAVCGGMKLFYKQDHHPIMTPEQVLQLTPPPLVVIYQ